MDNYTGNLSGKERREYFWYLLFLFVFVSGILTYLLLYKSTNPFNVLSVAERDILRQRTIFENKQKVSLFLYDTVMQKIKTYKSSPGNVLEAEINNDIKTMNSFYDPSPNSDSRNICFQKMATFLEMHFTDVINLHKSTSNSQFFQKQLDDCRMGIPKNTLPIRAANPTGH